MFGLDTGGFVLGMVVEDRRRVLGGAMGAALHIRGIFSMYGTPLVPRRFGSGRIHGTSYSNSHEILAPAPAGPRNTPLTIYGTTTDGSPSIAGSTEGRPSQPWACRTRRGEIDIIKALILIIRAYRPDCGGIHPNLRGFSSWSIDAILEFLTLRGPIAPAPARNANGWILLDKTSHKPSQLPKGANDIRENARKCIISNA